MPGQNLLDCDGFLGGHLVIFPKFLMPIFGIFPVLTFFACCGWGTVFTPIIALFLTIALV